MARQHTTEHQFGPFGDDTVLVVIDVQNGVVETGWDRDGILDRLATLIGSARVNGTPVVYVQHETPNEDDLRPGTDRWQIHQRVAPRADEPVVAKQYGDAFVETTLPETLASLNAGHLIIAGAQTNACVRSTLHRAMGLGYDVTLVSDCHTTDDIDWEGLSITGEQIVKHFNLEIRFSAYPGQKIQVLPQAEIELRHAAPAI